MERPTDMVETLDGLLRSAISGLIRQPSELKLDVLHKGASVVVFTLTVARSDYGGLIGRNGHHVAALRTLLRAWGKRYGLTVYLDVMDQRLRAQTDNEVTTSPVTE